MPNTYIEYSELGTGTNQRGQNQFSYANIEVLNANDIKCKGLLMNAWTDVPLASQGSLDSSANKKITLTASDALQYTKIRVYRQTTSNALVDFVDGARLTESDLDTAYKQGLFVAQEVAEDAAAIGTTSTNNLSLSGTTTVDNLTATGTVSLPSSTNLSVNNLTATGTVSIPNSNFAKLFVTNSAPQTLSANTLTDVVLNDEERDNTNSFANNTFTPPANGYYCIQGQVRVTCTDPNDLSLVELLLTKSDSPINGTTQGLSERHGDSSGGGGSNTNMTTASVSTFAIDFLTTNQPIKMRVKANSGAGTLSINAQDAAFGVFQLA
tara:strand:+ start:11931 stop:12902 length:972 start_codon:yes stop_codon:yes gene_type:complete